MTFLKGLFADTEKATTLTVRDDIITSDRVLGDIYGMFGSVALSADYSPTYEEIVRKQLWVRIAVDKLAYGIAGISLKVYERESDTNRRRTSDSPLAMLLDMPSELKEFDTTEKFIARILHDFFTYGNALVVKVQSRPDAVPSELRPVNPRGWTVKDGEYVYNLLGGGEKRFKPWQIMHFMEPGPTVSGFGVSRLEAARLTLAIEYAAQQLGAATFENGARPGGIINVKQAIKDPNVVERFKSEVMRRFGGVSKAGLPAVLEGDISWLPMSHNLDDSAVVNHRQLTREEIAALYDIPQPALGILDESNFASIDQLHVMLYQDTFRWPIKVIESTFKSQLIRGVPAFAGQYAEFDMNSVMRGAYAQRMAGHLTAINGRIATPDEIRALENLPPMADKQPEAAMLQFPLNYGVSSAPPGQEGP